MAWWRRRPSSTSPRDEAPDPYLTPLTVPQAAHLRALARSAFADLGLETVPEGGVLRLADGRTLGLTNLARTVAAEPGVRWAALVSRHARVMLASFEVRPPESLDAVRDTLFLRVLAAGDLPSRGGVRPFGADLVQAAAVDHPDHVATLMEAEPIDRLGGWDVVAQAARANLVGLRAEQTRRWVDETTGAEVLLSMGGFFHASRLLVLAAALAQDFGVEQPPHGVLVAVPNRHLLGAHVLVGVDEALVALQRLAALAEREHQAAPGPLSPNVYFWRDGAVSQVTRLGSDGRLVVDATGAFGQAMTEIGLSE